MECLWATLEAEVYHKVLVVGADAPLQSILRDHLRETDDFLYRDGRLGVWKRGFGLRAFTQIASSSTWPLDASKPVRSRRIFVRAPDHLGTILLALTSDEPGEETFALGFNDAFKKPFDGALLAERVRRLISQKKADEP